MVREIITLPSFRVDVVEEHARARTGVIRCEIGKAKNLDFSTEGLESYCFAKWQPVVFDALLVAAAVEFCDKTLRGPARNWGRNIRLRLPVHDLDTWRRPNVVSSLTDALNTLTGDCWNVEFGPRKHPEPQRRQEQFSLAAGARAVIPFSDGLDSWSGAIIETRRLGTSLLRVRLGSRRIRATHDDREQPFAYVPYQVRAGNRPFLQTGGRSRGFEFALISGIAAYLAGVTDVIIPESGQGCLGPVLVAAGQAYPDYRCHPSFMVRMERFLSALLGNQGNYRFPRLWHTKGETLRAAVSESADDNAWMQTRSCWQNSRQVSVDHKRRQCGICAACMLRRLSVHAAGLKGPRNMYVWEDLGSRVFEAGAARSFTNSTNALREYAIAGTLYLHHLAVLTSSPVHANVLKRHALEISRALGEPCARVEARLSALLQRHKEEWNNFMNSLGPKSSIAQWAEGSA